MAATSLVLLRTHFVSPEVEQFGAELKKHSGCEVVFIIDEQKGIVAAPKGFQKISSTKECFDKMGLFCTPDYAWRCGDYAFYIAAQQFTEVEFFWLVEYDVRINSKDPSVFFDYYSSNDADLICFDYEDAPKSWFWTKAISPFFAQPKKCLFPLVRASRQAIDLCLTQRKIIAAQFHAENWREYPNDEAFMASTVASRGLRGLCLREDGWGSQSEFRFRRPFSLYHLERSAPDEKIYHPVLRGKQFASKALTSLLNIHDTDDLKSYIEYLDQVLADEDADSTSLFASYKAVSYVKPMTPFRDSPRIKEISNMDLVHCTYGSRSVKFAVLDKAEFQQRYHSQGIFYEDLELMMIHSKVGDNKVILDVGASIGNHSVYFLKFMSPSRLIVVEPFEKAQELLRLNLFLNTTSGTAIVENHQVILSNTKHFGKIGLRDRKNWGIARVSEISDADGEYFVPANLGDAILDGSKVDFIKIDVGNEMLGAVLEGLEATIKRWGPKIMISSGSVDDPVVSIWMAEHFYRCTWFIRRHRDAFNMILEYDAPNIT